MKKQTFITVGALAASLFLASCSPEEISPRDTTLKDKQALPPTNNFSNSLTFDHYKFSSNIANAVHDKTLGYAARISGEGAKVTGVSGGLAVNLPNPNPNPFGYAPGMFLLSRRMETMQLSSTITAATLMKAIESKAGAITVDSPILPYLPANWKLGPNIKLLTFRHLLSNNSGLAPQMLGVAEPETDTYENLRKLIANGIPATYLQDRNGKLIIVDNRKLSVNYALMRILIPYLQNGAAAYKQHEAKGTNAEATSSAYVTLVTQLILSPSGILADAENHFTMPDVVPTASTPYTRYYQFGNTGNSWEQDALGRLYCGANRWYMSPNDYILFLDKLWAGNLLTASSLEVMKSGQMAMSFIYGTNGKYYYQKGYLSKNDAGLATIWMTYPNGIRVVLFINTTGGLPFDSNNNTDLQNILKKAYDDAWVALQ
jgi:CubicO group peptidase (beta-lactamase class C family)